MVTDSAMAFDLSVVNVYLLGRSRREHDSIM